MVEIVIIIPQSYRSTIAITITIDNCFLLLNGLNIAVVITIKTFLSQNLIILEYF